jgi:16S rRNA (adenine1518-N6/adenine1519-N6)-dimethyltransferase
MVLLLQKEVAERIAAGPGNHSILSITTQFYAEPEIVMEVPKEDFYPAPEVDSAVVKLVVRKAPLFDADEKKFFQLVKVGFSNKRKMLVNNLKALPHSVIASVAKQSQRDRHGLRPREDIKTLLEDLEINPKARAQDLTLNDWKALYDRFFK